MASLLGAAIGFEREVHAHPAGMRTHLLVSLGSAAFTVLGIFFFAAGTGTDPSRIAAQVVSGIGFLGAGAILKYGSTVRGLTTAASLWATAAVGMAAGAGAWVAAVVTSALIIFSLGPLHRILSRVRSRRQELLRLRIQVARLEVLGPISATLAEDAIAIAGVTTRRLGQGRYEVELDLRPPAGAKYETIIATISSIAGIEILDAGTPTE